jgi:tetratricopeptide (TPR) repeat protein
MRGLVRGLAAEPAARWPSMEILVERLREATRRPHRIRIAAVAAGAVAAAVIAIVLAASRVPDPFAAERAAAEQRIAAWNPAQARALAQAFAATHAPRAAEHASAVIERLDRYRASWLAARLDAWSATHVRHAQPARDLELRIACYDRLAAAMTGAVAALLAPGADDITAKIHTVDQLESIAICSQLDRLIELSTVPTNAAGDALEKQVDALEAKQNSGHIAEVLDQAQQLVASAQRVGGPGQLARARYILGISQIEVGSSEDAARTLRLALQDAAVARDHYLVARVWVRLVTVTGQNLGRLDEAIAMIPAAQAAIAQASDDLNLRAQFAEAELVLSYTRGDLVAALDYGGQALDLFTGSQGPRSDGVFNAETNLGIICAERGELDEAVRHLEAARKLATEIYGAHHPSIGYVEDALAVVARKRHDLAGAERHERAAIAISAAAHGPDNEVTAEFRVNLVDLLARRHRLAEARAELARARTSYRQALPAESAEVIMLDVREAQLAEAEGHARDAVRLARPAIERLRHTSVPAVKLAEALRRLARMVAHDQPGDALPIYDEAIRLGRERKPPDIAEDVELLNGAADAAERAHRPAAALPWFTRMPEAANQLSGRLHRLLAEAAR